MFSVSKSAAPVAAGELAGALDFDGTNDYLSRSSDLVGNADTRYLTLSFWCYGLPVGTHSIFDNGGLLVRYDTSGISLYAYTSSSTNLIQASFSIPQNTTCHVVISLDLANSSKRHVYVNDQPVSVGWSTYTYAGNIDMTKTSHFIAKEGGLHFRGRLAHLYLDYTYRDLSIEANRRLFIIPT